MNTKTAIITIAGRPNVGKSTLINHLVGEKIAIVSNKPQTTRNRICGIRTQDHMQFVFVDTPGYHKARTKLGDYMVNTVRESISDVDATLLVVEPIASVGSQEQALIEKIKLIDYYMDEFSDNLSKPFVSRLNANIDKKDLYRVNEITYMLIQTLSGKERIELIGFTED